MVEIRLLDERLVDPLAEFLRQLELSGAGSVFHPHEFAKEAVREIVESASDDKYYVVVDGDTIVGYGMLRGWDEGYDVPSLGIAIAESARGSGLAELLMRFLHYVAKKQGASRVRLTVYEANVSARRLFDRLGYVFESDPVNGRLTGYKQLSNYTCAE